MEKRIGIRILVVTIFILTSIAGLDAKVGISQHETAEIHRVLDAQINAWNHGDIDGFLDGYWKSPDLIYQGNSKMIKGWDTLRDFYHTTFAPPNDSLGTLSLTSTEISSAGKGVAIVWGRYEVITQAGKHYGGPYTLVMRKFSDGWKTIYDRTAAEK